MLLSYREELAMRLDLTEARVQVSCSAQREEGRGGLGGRVGERWVDGLGGGQDPFIK